MEMSYCKIVLYVLVRGLFLRNCTNMIVWKVLIIVHLVNWINLFKVRPRKIMVDHV